MKGAELVSIVPNLRHSFSAKVLEGHGPPCPLIVDRTEGLAPPSFRDQSTAFFFGDPPD
jgi:hypothetical protein